MDRGGLGGLEDTLDDLVSPAHIVAKRIRVRIDGSKLFKIYLWAI